MRAGLGCRSGVEPGPCSHEEGARAPIRGNDAPSSLRLTDARFCCVEQSQLGQARSEAERSRLEAELAAHKHETAMEKARNSAQVEATRAAAAVDKATMALEQSRKQ